jgi:hypothetical protein
MDFRPHQLSIMSLSNLHSLSCFPPFTQLIKATSPVLFVQDFDILTKKRDIFGNDKHKRYTIEYEAVRVFSEDFEKKSIGLR